MITLICQRCEKPFDVYQSNTRAKYCSKACHNGPRTTIKCQRCQQLFTVPANRRHSARYCSKVCFSPPTPAVICQRCEKPFIPKNYKGKAQQYCSKTCLYQIHEPIVLTCKGCQAQFTTIPSREAIAQYCSITCRNKTLLSTRPLHERFWEKVNKSSPDGCWEWEGGKDPNGYGMINIGKKPIKAHRVAWMLAHEERSLPTLHVCHHCDNPSCVSPLHLFLGTHQDNMRDMVSKGRNASKAKPEKIARGIQINTAKLTETDVLTIRALYSSGKITYKAIAETYHVTPSTIWQIIRRKSWTHI